MVFLKFEFVCVAIAPGGLDGCFGFGVKVVVPHAAKRAVEREERNVSARIPAAYPGSSALEYVGNSN